MAYAGIDIGTSGCKMIVYNEKGEVLSSATNTYRETGQNGFRELDGAMVWRCIKDVIQKASTACHEPIHCLAVSSLGESVLCVDQADNILAGSMLTGDKRGIAQCRILEEQITKEEVMQITGLPLSEMYSLPKFLWMHQHTDLFQKTERIFFFEDFVGYMLTGARMISYSSAARSMAFDIHRQAWSDKLLSLAGLTPSLFSHPVPSGTILGRVLPEVAKELSLSPNTLVAAGGHDQGCAGLGSGMITPHQGEDGQGTCEVMQFLLPKATTSTYMIENGIPCAPYVLPGIYLAQIEITTCGILMNWARDVLFGEIHASCARNQTDFFSYMDRRISDALPGELLVLPSFGSSGNPDVSYDARGNIWGLTIHTQPEELYQAIKEGMAYQIYMAYQTLAPLQIQSDVIRVTGGGAVSDYTLQLRADVLNVPMETIDDAQAGVLGCAILAYTAVHPNCSIEETVQNMVRIKKHYEPRLNYHHLYQKRYEHYKELYKVLTSFSNNFIMRL